MEQQPDLDFKIGMTVQLVVFVAWCMDIYYGFTTLDPYWAISAIMMLIWFIFAPWSISEYPGFLTNCSQLEKFSSIYARIAGDYRQKNYK